MDLSTYDLYSYLHPRQCDLRVYLRRKGVAEAECGPYEQVIERLGRRHEEAHRCSFPELIDVRDGTWTERLARTQAEMTRRVMPLYHPALQADLTFDGATHRVVGEPDFLFFERDRAVVRDCKIASPARINERDHPEILRTMELYGWLLERSTGRPPERLEVCSGTRELVPIAYTNHGAAALEVLREVVHLNSITDEPFHPVGWSNCGHCGFQDWCWTAAADRHDVAVVIGVDRHLARALHEEGVDTYDQLIDVFDERSLASFERPWGSGRQKVGKKAASILRNARAVADGQETVLQVPPVPVHPRYVMFDLEGLPPQLDETDRVYLWGVGVYEDGEGDFRPAVSDFGPDGDRRGWEAFLDEAEEIFLTHGDIPFVHWAEYEKTNVKRYIDRYGDRNGVGSRVLANLLNLLPIAEKSVVLPLPSYSLKIVERHVGFRRNQQGCGGDWAMAAYIEAVETDDLSRRDELMQQILTYNREDLDAMWAVMEWLRTRVPAAW